MSNPAIERFIEDYEAYNKSLTVPHPYFQQVEYIKVNSMIISELLKRRHAKVLDVGSGSGHLINGLSASCEECVALDIEPDRLVFLHSKNPEIRGVTADVDCGLPFKSGVFDAVVASELLEHLNDPKHFFAEMVRILKENGVLIITTPNIDNFTYRIMRALPSSWTLVLAKKANVDMRLHPSLVKGKENIDSDPHAHKVEGYSKKELVDLGEGYGLRSIHHISFGLPLPDSLLVRPSPRMIRFIVNHLEDHVPFPLRHLIVYEKQINTRTDIEAIS